MGLFAEFKEFALKGSVLDLAVGVIIGAAFGKIVNSAIEDLLMPVVGLTGNVDFSKAEFVLRKADPLVAGSKDISVRYGNFVTIAINFLILALCIFLVVKLFNTARKRFESQAPVPPPPGPTKDQLLLTDIRDLLAKGR